MYEWDLKRGQIKRAEKKQEGEMFIRDEDGGEGGDKKMREEMVPEWLVGGWVREGEERGCESEI